MQKIALITGASRGIGAATAEQLAADGYTVALGYLARRDDAEALATRLGGIALQADVADSAACAALVQAVTERLGAPPEVLVSNAGIAKSGVFQCIPQAEAERLYAVNLLGARNSCAAVLPGMIARQRGVIVTVSSVWGEVGASCEVDYSAAKAGVIGLTRALAKEVAPSGIRVNCVTPGVIDTEMNAALDAEARAALCDEIPLGRLGTPAEVAAAIGFLVSPAAGYITGQVLAVGGGFAV